MDLTCIGILSVNLILLLLALGIKVALVFIITGFLGTLSILGFDASIALLGQTMYYSINSPNFNALPLFILMGAFAARGGFAKRAYDGLHAATKGLPGALAIATSYSCAAFGAISGSSLATTAIFGKLALPEMDRHGYKKSFAVGTIASAGTFAAMIPPSILLLFYGLFTEQSIGKLFAAGIVPGLITATVYSISIIYRCKNNPELVKDPFKEKSLNLYERIQALGKIWPIVIIAIIVLGGIYAGLFTPTEAAAAGCTVVFIFAWFQGKLRNWSDIKDALRESARTSAMVFIIMVAALYFSRFFAMTDITFKISTAIQLWEMPKIYILSGILIFWFFLGMILIPMGIYALTLPIIFPIILKLGYDPIWFGIITLKISEIAAITPPVGLNVYVMKGVAGKGVSLETVFSGIFPFLLCDIIVLIFLIIFPNIALWLPKLLLG